ncbi:B3 domain-containing protein Os01g0234100-like isoform X2 [Humulus lupulus]|uniref:B3 domain-containing protein Os01g0234100-like isoform X2 n=1 Tax=Humulus lupulus TaxID=3486 RepID=UPI002B403CE0|nr:B3 domain-containing protein Os01g0234100-like isoform X2 [Humulus lupulus]
METVSFEHEIPEDVTLAQLSKSPRLKLKHSSSSTNPAKKKILKEKEEEPCIAKKRNPDVQIKFVVSGHARNSLIPKPSKVAIHASPLSGEAKSSAVMRGQEVRSNLETEFPSFVKSLVRSHVASCFWMGLPGPFCKSHLPDKDTTITLEDEDGKRYHVKYIAYKTGLSAGWRQFSVAHKLLEGDVLVFQLVEPTKFKVYVIRANDLTEVDGALGLLNLDCQSKQSDADNYAELGAIECYNTNRKRPKSLPLSVVEKKKKKKDVSPRSAPPKPADQSENDSDEVASEVLEGSKLLGPAIQFKDIKSFKNFSILVDGLLVDSEIPEDIRKAYYKLCCSKKAFLHENIIKGMNHKLIVGIITETVNVASAIKACKLTTSLSDFAAWDKSLKAFELLGMNVGFLRARLSHLTGLAIDSEVCIDARKYAQSRKERADVETGMKDIETKIVELRDACVRFDAAIDKLGSQAETYERKFHREVKASW